MRTRGLFATVLMLVFASTVAQADPPRRRRPRESASALTAPTPGVRPLRAVNPDRPPEPEVPPEARPWRGPRVEIGFVHYTLSDGIGGGPVNAVSIGGYLPTGYLRLGVVADAGSRRYTYAENDIALRASAMAGVQLLNALPLLPYAVLRADVGTVLAQRFSTTDALGLFGFGVEIGLEVNPGRNFHLGIGLGYTHAQHRGLSYPAWTFRFFVGL